MAKRLKVPKQIGGIKIPKPIRKGPVGKFINSTAGQVLAAEALLAAGAALVAKRGDADLSAGEFLRHPVEQLRDAGHSIADQADDAKDTLAEGTERLARAFREAMQAFQAALADEATVGRDDGDGRGVYVNEDGGGKKAKAHRHGRAAH